MTIFFAATFIGSLVIGSFMLHPLLGIIVLSFVGFTFCSAFSKWS